MHSESCGRNGGIGQNGLMPQYTRPALGELLEVAIGALGDPVRVIILQYLREHGPASRGVVSEELGIPAQTTSRHLRAMASAGVVRADPPLEHAKRGQWVKYEINDERITELYRELGRALNQE